jgi:hypothetical protein
VTLDFARKGSITVLNWNAADVGIAFVLIGSSRHAWGANKSVPAAPFLA